ncbi:carboxyl-terminal processing protease [Maridesulfovibrio ferrireducens]|uniref:Carboxyl-terminal processing protease n=1 Tax=Maridesulfovibrio ferrireducens TaxID=246191 RepID=A0A1G9KK89_9BACT|nr:S41 family peptidase [Maridesulfovibrio ferrireducens]SDL50141.1 carboxyl-terminal processing protease [Maridesulfovibrio ferrireducens]
MPAPSIDTFSLRKYFVILFACLSVFLLNGNTGCGVDPTTRIFKATEVEDFSKMGWLEAYDAFHALMQKQYAFGDWKGINWSALNSSIRPKIVIAEAAAAGDDYITALLEYTRSIPDGHITWNNPIFGIIEPNIKGSYGLGMIGLDNGKVIANVVSAGGPAATAGIDVGSEILEWNDVAIATAAAQVSTLWRPNPASIATNEHKLLEQYRALALDPVATNSKVKYLKSDASGPFTTVLIAADDNRQIQTDTGLWNKVDDANPIKREVLVSGYGYIMLGTLESEDISQDQLFNKFKEAMEFLTGNNVPGIIIDLRGNSGGSDDLAAKIAGFFYSETTFYEYQNLYNAQTERLEIVLPSADDSYIIGWDLPLNITPQSLQFTGPVVALVNPDSVSSAEGVAMAIKNLANGYVVGFYGTNGSFGMTGGGAKLPLGYQISFPNGQSLNINKEVQLDSRNGIGGIVPDIRVPRTSARMINYANDVDVELAYAITYLQSL